MYFGISHNNCLFQCSFLFLYVQQRQYFLHGYFVLGQCFPDRQSSSSTFTLQLLCIGLGLDGIQIPIHHCHYTQVLPHLRSQNSQKALLSYDCHHLSTRQQLKLPQLSSTFAQVLPFHQNHRPKLHRFIGHDSKNCLQILAP